MIYYSHVNEDNRVERDLFAAGSFSSALVICGSGERVLALMDNRVCKKMVVVDNNEEAIFLLQLKIAAITVLSVDDYLGFIGHHKKTALDRVQFFHLLEGELPQKTLSYWEKNLFSIRRGLLHIGHFERFLQRARPLTNTWLGKSFQNVFQKEQHLNDFSLARWKVLKKVFSWRIVYQLLGNSDIAFTGSSAQLNRIPTALDKIITNGNASACFMAHLIFKGHLLDMDEESLPPSLQKSVLSKIKARLSAGDITIEYYISDLLHYLQMAPQPEQAVFYSLSDLLSFADVNYLSAILKEVSTKESCIVGRSFLRNRLNTEQLSSFKQYGKATLHDDKESTGMYQVFSLQTQPVACTSC